MPKQFDCVDHNKLWKILKEMGIPDHLTCLLRNLYAGQEATIRTGHGTTDWFQIGKGVHQGCILSSCLFNLYAYLTYLAYKHKLESRFPGEISITSDMHLFLSMPVLVSSFNLYIEPTSYPGILFWMTSYTHLVKAPNRCYSGV